MNTVNTVNTVNMTPDEVVILDKIKEMLKDTTVHDYYDFDIAYNLLRSSIPSHPPKESYIKLLLTKI